MKNYVINKLEKLFIGLDNLNYRIITKLVIMNNPNKLHPKHYILNYHEFFTSHIKKDSIVLDIGCGNGALTSDIANIPTRVTGIDMNKDNIINAKKKYGKDRIIFVHGDATNDLDLDLLNNGDYIILSNVLEHIEYRVIFLKKIKMLLYSKGIILIRVPMINRDWLTIYKKEIGMEYRLDKTHYIEYTLESLKEELNKAGLYIKEYKIEFGEILAVVGMV